MNMLVPNFVANQKSGFEIMYSLMAKGLDGFEKLITLNSQAVNSMLVENQEAVVKALAAKDPQELFALQASQTRSAMDKAQSYWRHVYEIVSAAQGEFAEVTEAHFKQSQLDAQAFVDGLAKNAPARRPEVRRSSQLGSPFWELLPSPRTPRTTLPRRLRNR